MIAVLLRRQAYNEGWIERAVSDIPEEQRTRQFDGAVNHAAWTIGHLVFSTQAIGGELGLCEWLGADWRARFGGGSRPNGDAAATPTLAELRAAWRDGNRRLKERIATLTPAELEAPLPDARFHAMLPTVGDALWQVVVGHTAFHAGQLAAWRRALGRAVETYL